jgi:sugar lactone lactonase YvrE
MRFSKGSTFILLITVFLLSGFNARGAIVSWELSKSFPAGRVNLETANYPRFYTIFFAQWRAVSAEPTGLINISTYSDPADSPEPDLVLARHIFRCEKAQQFNLTFGFGDEAAVFFNGHKIFYGNRTTDPPPAGITARLETVSLTMKRGLNEIMFAVKEHSGAWGFRAEVDAELLPPRKQPDPPAVLWETPAELLTPESVLYDSQRKVLYVSSFDNRFVPAATEENYTGYISRLNLDGKIEQLKWAAPLHAPCGLGIYDNNLYTVERRNLVEIDLDTGRIKRRYPIPGADFPNDLAIDKKGNIYISDTSPSDHQASRIYKFSEGEFAIWENGPEIVRANGLFVHDGFLLVGNTGDSSLKSIHLESKKISTITGLGAGVVDGIRVDRDGNYLVSHWEGKTYRVSTGGGVLEIMDIMDQGLNSADFEFIKEKNVLIMPTFIGNKVVAYQL